MPRQKTIIFTAFTTPQEVHQIISDYIKKKGLNIKDFMEVAGVARYTFYTWKNGGVPTFKTLAKLVMAIRATGGKADFRVL